MNSSTCNPSPKLAILVSRSWSGWLLWVLLFLVIAILVERGPDAHTVTLEYRGAAEKWMQRADLYHLDSIHGFLYLPVSALLYLPFTFIPKVPGEMLWRLISIGVMAWATSRLAHVVLGAWTTDWFWLLSVLVIPACLSSARNGQTNLPLSALMILAVLELTSEKWNSATVWLILCLFLKPIAGILILLGALLYAPMRVRLLFGGLLLMAVPWINSDWGYVLREHQQFFQKMIVAGDPKEQMYNDLRGLLAHFGLNPSHRTLLIFRCLSAVVVFFLAWNLKWLKDRSYRTALFLGALNASFLMIFNPRTEANSYVILVPFIALVACEEYMRRKISGRFIGFSLMALSLGADSYGKTIFLWADYWLKPAIALIFLCLITTEIVRARFWNAAKKDEDVTIIP